MVEPSKRDWKLYREKISDDLKDAVVLILRR